MQVDLTTYRQHEGPAIGAVQRALILKTFPAFGALPASELAVIASIAREVHFPAGAVMHEPGVPVVRYHLVVEGDVQMYRGGKPSKKFTGRSAIGGLASLTRDPHGAHAVAVTDVLALEIDTDDMQDVFEDNYNICVGILKALAGALRQGQIARGGGAAVEAKTAIVDVTNDEPLTLIERMFFLRQTTNFEETSIEALADLAEGLVETTYKAGEVIWKAGSMGKCSIQVLSGTVECVPPNGKPFGFGAGMIVGGLDTLSGKEHWYSCVAKTDVRIFELHTMLLFDVLEDHIEVALQMLSSLAKGMTAMMEAMANAGATEASKAKEVAPKTLRSEA